MEVDDHDGIRCGLPGCFHRIICDAQGGLRFRMWSFSDSNMDSLLQLCQGRGPSAISLHRGADGPGSALPSTTREPTAIVESSFDSCCSSYTHAAIFASLWPSPIRSLPFLEPHPSPHQSFYLCLPSAVLPPSAQAQ